MKWILTATLTTVTTMAHAQYMSSGSSSPAATGPKNSTTRFALVGGTVVRQAQVEIAGATAQQASGSGYAAGFELSSSTNWPRGNYTAGVLYTAHQIQFNPNGVREINRFQAIEVPLSWGFYLGSRFLISAGIMARYELDKIIRENSSGTTAVSHKDYGLSPIQADAIGSIKYYQNIGRKPRLFIDLRFGTGLLDQAIGSADHWHESNLYAGLGILFW